MKTTIVYAHPWSGSFNQSILSKLVMRYPEASVIDLYGDQFNPVMSVEELALFSKGESLDPLIKDYQLLLQQTNRLIVVFPIWWYGMPAILKGFFDKVMLKEFAYKEGKAGVLVGQLSQVKETYIVTTSQSPTWYIKYFGGNPIAKTLIKRVLKDIGLKKVKWINEGTIATSPKEKKNAFLDRLAKI
ncbi:NAD(P)H-dependent oxidoreductase [uncultured Vagococcus sp.]|uniref:NAD(P)H-dependent oxidoreductase n=1 Tax=uncultured Vagococcus sp. TaxID=189676 RepID=UPI0028D18610|nr:NAD(P)H-dependent oxidoreductase [uncultured Vagococcus sp.]